MKYVRATQILNMKYKSSNYKFNHMNYYLIKNNSKK